MFPEYPFISKYLSIGKDKLHYIDEGNGPVVVMVHGNPTWSYYYRNVISLLSARFRVIALDHMGCGLSDKPQNYSYNLETHIENLDALLNHLGLGPFSMMVHDWGGAIGLGYAGLHPERVEKIVILNTAAFRSSRIPFRIRICRWPFLGAVLVRGMNGFVRAACHMAVTKKMKREIAESYLAPYDSWKNRVAVHGFVKDIPLTQGHPSYALLVRVEQNLEKLKKRSCPIMILWGGKDFCFDRYFYQEWCERFPNAEKHYFEDWGHYILEDAFEDIAPLLKTFFQFDDISGGGENHRDR